MYMFIVYISGKAFAAETLQYLSESVYVFVQFCSEFFV